MSCTILLLYLLFQDLSEEEADRPTLEVLRELVSLFVLKILRPTLEVLRELVSL